MSGWYYKDEDDNTLGVFSDDEMKLIAARGGLVIGTRVMHEDKTNGEWVSVDRIVALRTRIDANADARRESANAEKSEVRRAYAPPRRSRAAQLSVVKAALNRTAKRAAQVVAAVGRLASSETALHTCPKCEHVFARYDTPGRCPLCGEWELIACGSCGFRAGARSFVENKFNCPRCGAKAKVTGTESHTRRDVVFMVAVSVILITIVGITAVVLWR